MPHLLPPIAAGIAASLTFICLPTPQASLYAGLTSRTSTMPHTRWSMSTKILPHSIYIYSLGRSPLPVEQGLECTKPPNFVLLCWHTKLKRTGSCHNLEVVRWRSALWLQRRARSHFCPKAQASDRARRERQHRCTGTRHSTFHRIKNRGRGYSAMRAHIHMRACIAKRIKR